MTTILPRGIRNNNPGNIRLSKIMWQGQKRTENGDKVFAEFVSGRFGIRALMKLMLNYYLKYGLDTVESIINRYAPPCENATDNYISHVSKILGVNRRTKMNLANARLLINLAKAITLHENGRAPEDMPYYWYEDKIYEEAAENLLT